MKKFSLVCFAIASLAASALSLHAHEAPKMNHDGHHQQGSGHGAHKMVNIPVSQPVPKVALMVHPDPTGGWNLEIKTENFKFAPENLNAKSHTLTEGHAHLYVDGKKITRVYGNWYYLSNLEPGKRTLTVILSTNAHEDLMHNGQLIQATKVIQAP